MSFNCYYHFEEPEDLESGRWVPYNFFCHNGEWAAKVKVKETTYEDGKQVSVSFKDCVKVSDRSQMISCFLNNNLFEWL
jgi:hypothetical protein